MATYTVQAPDGKTITLEGPEGASEADVIAQAQRLYSGGQQAAPAAPEQDKGLVYNSFVRGLVYDPIAAVREMVGGEEARKQVAAEEAAYQRYRQQKGDEGFEWGRLAGGVALPLPGAGLVKGAGMLSKLGRAAAFGGGVAATQPVFSQDPEANFIGEKLFQVGGGLALGGATKAAFGAVRGGKEFLSELVKPMTEKGRQQLIEDFLAKITDPADRAKIAQALSAAEKDIVPGSRATAAQALADTPEAANILALQAKVEPSARPQFAARELEQQAAQQKALQFGQSEQARIEAILGRPLEPGELQALSDQGMLTDIRKRLGQRKGEETGPMREQVLQGANAAGMPARASYIVNEAADVAERQANELRAQMPDRVATNNMQEFLAKKNEAAQIGDAAAQKQLEAAKLRTQAQSLNKTGVYALESDRLIQRLDDLMANPGDQANEVLMRVLGNIRTRIRELSPDGVIDSRNLYQLRKNINLAIEESFGKGTVPAERAAQVEKQVRGIIDSELNKSGPAGMWKKYLEKFSAYSKLQDQVSYGRLLSGKLGEAYVTDIPNAGAFYRAVEDSARSLKTATRGTYYSEPSELLSRKQMTAVNNVLLDLRRAAKAKARTKPSTAVGGDITTTPELPPLLSRTATVVNAVIKYFKGDAVEAMNKEFAKMLLEPKLLATAISNIDKKNAPGFIEAIFPKLTPENQRALIDAMGIGAAVDFANTPPPAM